ncbi:MAG: formate dehydrogenase accessory sulfurtransferase FdhD [Candidatus Methanoperedens sp.]|nr:formate dehydrogenase accessory sulfurtransferase FdhD [Candidatus Methanoperedens sp.]MCE8425092.1 formate dehydrogenase accessory sulfurtransferase FdhD [Candidatus Methanoperedens sp.]MCE8427747.1 formate dehydrogenase accessory sulfurtransferase FdhD [Candidatus Methanoperedens sp.]
MYIKNYQALELSGSSKRESAFSVAVEDSFELFINDLHVAVILATPEMLKELAVGYLVCEGIVKEHHDIKNIRIDGRKIRVDVEATEHLELWRELRSSGCVGIHWDENEEISVRSDTIFSIREIKKSLAFLESDIYRLTHGTHVACLVNTKGECVANAIDVGRHNAIDKVVGRAILDRIRPGDHFLLSSGRQSAGMVQKAARAGIPIIAAKSAPLNTGIDAAKKSGVCLICFVSNERMSVFSHPERLGLLARKN